MTDANILDTDNISPEADLLFHKIHPNLLMFGKLNTVKEGVGVDKK